MRRFITKKKIKIPRYRLYYFILAFTIFLVFGLNFIVHFFLRNTESSFIDYFVGNSFGNALRDDFIRSDSFLFYTALGIDGIFLDDGEIKVGSIKEVGSSLDEVVYLYNTFQTDQYQSHYFNRYSIQPFVVQASFILQEYLKSYGIGSVVEEDSVAQVLKKQNISYSNSYAASKILLQKRTEEFPGLKYFFDLQIADDEKKETSVVIEGEEYAKILFVVGTDQDNYQLNQAFATRLNELLLDKEKNLTRGISLRGGEGYQGVYNQDFSSKALLIQVGGCNNTIDEVNRSLKVLAEVIATYIKEDIHEEKSEK